MSKLCVVMQPTYLPWLGYFDLIDQADVFVFLDNVQLVKRSWMVRNRIKTAQGEQFLSIPVQKTGHRDDIQINTAQLAMDQPWREKHLKTMALAYQKAPHFKAVYGLLEHLYAQEPSSLAQWNQSIIQAVAEHMGMTTPFVQASSLDGIDGQKDDRLLGICQALDCDQYLSTPGAAVYLEAESPGGELAKHGIEVSYHQYEHPSYPQRYHDFLPAMAIVDLLFNVGFEESLVIIRQGRLPMVDCQAYRRDVLMV